MADLPREICSQSIDKKPLHDSYAAGLMVLAVRPWQRECEGGSHPIGTPQEKC